MGKIGFGLSWRVRPQLLASLVAAACVLAGVQLQAAAGQEFQAARGRQAVPAAAVEGALAPLVRDPIPPVDCSVAACMALTFDDGPHAAITPQVLDVLDRHKARATFFVLGAHVAGNEHLLRRMYQRGHEIGNHSWSHGHFTRLTPAQMVQEITMTQAAVVASGVPAPALFRPPYGDVDAVVRSHVPLTIALWNVDPEDWRAKRPDDIALHIQTHAGRGRVVDLHDTHQVTADSLEHVITALQGQYQLVTFSELFHLTGGQPGLFYGR